MEAPEKLAARDLTHTEVLLSGPSELVPGEESAAGHGHGHGHGH